MAERPIKPPRAKRRALRRGEPGLDCPAVIVWVASYPRSGNHLFLLTLRDRFGVDALGVIVEEDLRLGRPPGLPERPPKMAPWQLPPGFRGLLGPDLLNAVRERPEPYFIKTHRLAEAPDRAPAVYIVRDGRDALVSHAHFVEARDAPRFRGQPFRRRLADLIDPGIRAYGTWSRNVRAWRDRTGATEIVRYEDLVADPTAEVSRVCDRLGIPLTAGRGSVTPFAELQADNPIVYRRGVVGAWRDEMPPDLERRFWGIHGAEMKALGYRRR